MMSKTKCMAFHPQTSIFMLLYIVMWSSFNFNKSLTWKSQHPLLPSWEAYFGNDITLCCRQIFCWAKVLATMSKNFMLQTKQREYIAGGEHCSLYLYHYNLAQSIKLTPGSDPKMTNNKTWPQLICKLLLSQFPFCKRNAPIVEDEWTYRPVRKPSVPNKHVVADASKMCLSWW